MIADYETRSSPNHGPRAPGMPVDILLLHYTGMASAEGALTWLCDPRSEVSSHWFVFEDGRTVQLVEESRRAWHAGKAFWRGDTDINSRSIGIEIANAGPASATPDFPPAQIAALIALCRGILARHPIPAERVLAHSDVAPERKQDPGVRFPWRVLAEAGIGLLPASQDGTDDEAPLAVGHFGTAVKALQSDLAAWGFALTPTGVFDWETELAVLAFQRHWRQARVDGVADAGTRRALADLFAQTGANARQTGDVSFAVAARPSARV